MIEPRLCLLLIQREVDRNQDLLTRIKKIEEREAETKKVLNEQIEMNKALKKSIESQNKKLDDKDSKMANANEVLGLYIMTELV